METYKPARNHISDKILNLAKRARNIAAAAGIFFGSLAAAYAQDAPKPSELAPVPAHLTEKKPAAETQKPAQNSATKIIMNSKGYIDHETTGITGTGKAILDLGNWGLDLYGTAFSTRQEFDDYDINGSGKRAWAGAHAYLPLARDIILYGAAAGGIEDRIYTIDNGPEDFDFGNKGLFATATLGVAQGRLNDPDNFGVANDMNRLLLKATKHNGSAEGDAKEQGYGDNHDALRASAEGRLTLSRGVFIDGDSLAATGGISYLSEKIGEFLKQNHTTGEAGMRWNLPDHKGFIEPVVVVQDLESTVAGKKTTDRLAGPQLKTGLRVYSSDTATVDATLDTGYLFSRETDNEWYVAPGLTVWLGKKSR